MNLFYGTLLITSILFNALGLILYVILMHKYDKGLDLIIELEGECARNRIIGSELLSLTEELQEKPK